jgi:hypothetical protein
MQTFHYVLITPHTPQAAAWIYYVAAFLIGIVGVLANRAGWWLVDEFCERRRARRFRKAADKLFGL